MSDHSGNSDDEYGPIASAWGDQSADLSTNDSETDVIAGWRALSDPNAKIGPSGLGTGGLHRKGKNYKPIDEELILKHRKNGAGLGTSDKQSKQKKLNFSSAANANDDKKQRFSKPKGSRSQEQQQRHQQQQDGSRPTKTNNRSSTRNISQSSSVTPSIGKNFGNDHYQPSRVSSERVAPPRAAKSAWSNKALVDEPFWEKTSTRPSPTPRSSDNRLTSPWELPYKANKNSFSTTPEQQLMEMPWDTRSTANKCIQDKGSAGSQNSNAQRWAEWSSTKTSTDDGWQSKKDWQHSSVDGWNQVPSTTIANTSSTSTLQESKNENWQDKQAYEKGWVSSADAVPTAPKDDSCTWNNKDDTGWNMPPVESQQPSPTTFATGPGGRFSNPRRPKYSQRNGTKPVPINYRGNTPLTPPKEVAPPPPMDNPILVTINVELTEGNKIPVEIRLHDDPKQLAFQFGRNHLIDSAGVIDALCNLFQTQKNNAMKRRRKPL